ncbi:uncharacterized protein LOC132203445 [Neocloeon triangulifer]|uniref:uncharacterized protein LOC132203445 n=1 Tax=Neocloeon triangulifer TaxID=2078957 RepID=UPI00286F13B6|nr:uncharacterized protein LOC132203445 [Neocloeon triangulifer]
MKTSAFIFLFATLTLYIDMGLVSGAEEQEHLFDQELTNFCLISETLRTQISSSILLVSQLQSKISVLESRMEIYERNVSVRELRIESLFTMLSNRLECKVPTPAVANDVTKATKVLTNQKFNFNLTAGGNRASAKAQCDAQRMHLVFIETEEKLREVVAALPDKTVNYWVGAHYAYSHGLFYWDSGKVVDEKLWNPDNKGRSNELQCVELHGRSGKLYRQNCAAILYFICEKS